VKFVIKKPFMFSFRGESRKFFEGFCEGDVYTNALKKRKRVGEADKKIVFG